MAVNILLIGARLVRNLGGPSLLPTTINVIDNYIKDTNYTFITPTPEDIPLADKYDVCIIPCVTWKRVIPAAFVKSIIGLSFGSPETRKIIESIKNTDLVIDIWGISFTDSLGTDRFRSRAYQGIHFLVAKLFKKPVIKYTSDLGPFEKRWNRIFSKLYLQYTVDLILARDDITKYRLEELGITTKIVVCPDTAFMLEPESTPFAENLSKQKTSVQIIGFSVSHMAARQSGNIDDYLTIIAKLADYIIDCSNTQILFIPNELSTIPENDDLYYIRETVHRMRNHKKAIIVDEEYTAPQLKGIIGQCDIMIASRYHTIIASLSQSIPVLVIGWHEKYHGVLSLFGLEEYLFSVRSLDLEQLITKFDDLQLARSTISQNIEDVLPEIYSRIKNGGKVVNETFREKVRGDT